LIQSATIYSHRAYVCPSVPLSLELSHHKGIINLYKAIDPSGV